MTGGAGYLGSVMIPKLLNQGYNVTVLDPLIFGKDPVKQFFNHPNCDIQIGVSDDRYLLNKCIDGCFAIIHLSGLSNDPSCELDADLTRKANVNTTSMLLELAKVHKVKRFLYASSCSVYGFSEMILDEGSPTNPLTAYAKSKVDSENILLKDDGDLTITSLRKSTLFGPSPRMRFDLVINTMVGSAITDKKILVNGGNQWRPFLHVEDAADAYMYMLKADSSEVDREIFNIGSNSDNLTILELADKITNIIQGIDIKNSNSIDKRSYRVSFSKINKCLGFECKTDLKQGIKNLITMIKKQKISDYKQKYYHNFLTLGG